MPATLATSPNGNTNISANTNATPAANAAKPAGAISFAPLGTPAFDYKLAIKITLANNSSQTFNFAIGANTDPQTVTNLVLAALPASKSTSGGPTPGYLVTVNPNGTGFTVTGYIDNRNNVTNFKAISASVSKGSTDQAPANKPSTSTSVTGGGASPEKQSSALDPAQPSVNGLAFSFAPSSIDGTSDLQDETSIQAMIDGQTVTLDESGGSSYSQVASDLYNLLLQEGLTGVLQEGSEVIVTNDFSGQPVSNIQLDATDTSGQSMNWIDMGVDSFQSNASFVSLSSSVNPSTPNQAVTFTANVSGNSVTPTGTVTFMADNTILGTSTLDANGNATITTSTLTLGSHAITAVYNGDYNYASNAASLTQTVSLAATNTYVGSPTNPSQPGQSVTFTATVAAVGMSANAPTGTVTFYNGTSVLGTGTLTQVNGQTQATFTTSFGAGRYAITAIYGGDSTFAGSTGLDTQTVGQPSTVGSSTSLTSSLSPALPGQAVTFTAKVSGMGMVTPTGTVTFLDGNTVLGTASLDANGNATFTTSALALGPHDITAIYSGDGTYADSASSLTQFVVQGGTSMTLTTSANPSPSGQEVTFTATVAAMGMGMVTPTGTVSFYDGTTLLGTGTLSLVNGQLQATFTTAALGLGSHTIVAIYSGDSTFADSGASLQEEIS